MKLTVMNNDTSTTVLRIFLGSTTVPYPTTSTELSAEDEVSESQSIIKEDIIAAVVIFLVRCPLNIFKISECDNYFSDRNMWNDSKYNSNQDNKTSSFSSQLLWISITFTRNR